MNCTNPAGEVHEKRKKSILNDSPSLDERTGIYRKKSDSMIEILYFCTNLKTQTENLFTHKPFRL